MRLCCWQGQHWSLKRTVYHVGPLCGVLEIQCVDHVCSFSIPRRPNPYRKRLFSTTHSVCVPVFICSSRMCLQRPINTHLSLDLVLSQRRQRRKTTKMFKGHIVSNPILIYHQSSTPPAPSSSSSTVCYGHTNKFKGMHHPQDHHYIIIIIWRPLQSHHTLHFRDHHPPTRERSVDDCV